METRRLAKCYINYISNHRDRVQPLFELLSVVSQKSRCDYTFVKDFYVDLVADKYTVEEKKKVSLASVVFILCIGAMRMSEMQCCKVTTCHAHLEVRAVP